ncbi:MAG: polysaccharide pyruvyl transferase CsaB [Clostridiales bacterium]|nr:polysaccharide pyruvyl transferase CsaB [Clostridiales bacterium]
MINILIAGYHGYGNCGDEATLQAMTVNIKAMAEDVKITALSFKPELTKTEYNIESVQRFNVLQVFNAIRRSDIILSGGGTLLQDDTSTRSLLYYLSIIKVAKMLHKRVMLYANGIGPVHGKINRKLIKYVVNNVDFITLRESMSAKDLEELGVKKPETRITADPAFTLKSVGDKRISQIFDEEKIPLDKDIIGVSVRNWNGFGGEGYIERIASVCDRFAKEGKIILLIPMQFPKDVPISKRLMGAMTEKSYILKNKYAPAEILGIIGKVHIMLSMRLHTLIFAGVKRVPMAGVIYASKVDYYLKVLDMPSGGDIRCSDIDERELYKCIYDIFENYDEYVSRLNKRVEVLERKAHENDFFLNGQLDLIRKETRDNKNEK